MKAAVFSFALFGLLASASAQTEGELRKQLNGAYTELHTGFEKTDIKLLQKFFDRYGHPQFTYIGTGGTKQNAKQLLAQFKAGMGGLKVINSDVAIDRLTIKGNTATVKTIGDWRMKLSGSNGPTTVKGKTLMTDTWVKTSAGWKLKVSKVDSEKMTSNR